MMTLIHAKYNIKIAIEDVRVSVLVVENPTIMRELVLELGEQTQGNPGDFILSVDYEPIPISKNLVLIKSPLDVDCNDKKILAKLYQNIIEEERAQYRLEKENFDKAYLEYLRELCLLSPLPLAYDEKMSLGELLKSAHVIIDHSENSYVEKLWHYIQILGDLLHIKVFVFVNLKCFLSVGELELLYTQCFYEHKILILLESREMPPREDEKKCIVDADGCVIYY